MPHRIKRSYLILLLIIILAAGLRFYHLPEMANYDFDQEYAANFAYLVVKVFPVQLIGQESSVPGLYLGPLYFYYLTPFLALTNLHPIGGYIGSIILGLITIAVYFFVAKEMFGTKAGLVVAFLKTIHFTNIAGAWSMVPSYSSELAVLLTWWCFWKIWKGEKKFFIPLGFLFGLYTSFHPILFPFYLVLIGFLIYARLLPNLKIVLLSLIAFIIPLIPLIIFEYLHEFLEVRKLFELYGNPGTGGTKDIEKLIYYLKINIQDPLQFLQIKFLSDNLLILSLLIIFGGLLYKRIVKLKTNFHLVMLAITYPIFLLYYFLLPTHVPEYYFGALSTLSFLYLSALLAYLLKAKSKLLLILSLLLILNIFYQNIMTLHQRWNNPSLITLAHKDHIIKEILKRQPQNEDFYVSYIKEPGWNFGFDYLFKLYGHQPGKEIKQPIYTIVIPKSLSPGAIDVSSGNIGLILPD